MSKDPIHEAADWAEHEMQLDPDSTTAQHGDDATAAGRALLRAAEQEHTLYADPANQEPQGRAVRRRTSRQD